MKGLIQGQYGAYGLWYAIIFIMNATTPQIIPGIMFFIIISMKTNGDIDKNNKNPPNSILK